MIYDFHVRFGFEICPSLTCTAGQGEACPHIAAVLVALEDFTSLSLHSLPDDPARTEMLHAWNAPRTPRYAQCSHDGIHLPLSNAVVYSNIAIKFQHFCYQCRPILMSKNEKRILNFI